MRLVIRVCRADVRSIVCSHGRQLAGRGRCGGIKGAVFVCVCSVVTSASAALLEAGSGQRHSNRLDGVDRSCCVRSRRCRRACWPQQDDQACKAVRQCAGEPSQLHLPADKPAVLTNATCFERKSCLHYTAQGRLYLFELHLSSVLRVRSTQSTARSAAMSDPRNCPCRPC